MKDPNSPDHDCCVTETLTPDGGAIIHYQLTDALYRKLAAEADDCGMTVPDYIKWLLLND